LKRKGKEVPMPAKSKDQRRFMGIARAIQKGEMPAGKSPAAAKVARSMKPGELHKFAATKEKGLPQSSPKVKTIHKGIKRSKMRY